MQKIFNPNNKGAMHTVKPNLKNTPIKTALVDPGQRCRVNDLILKGMAVRSYTWIFMTFITITFGLKLNAQEGGIDPPHTIYMVSRACGDSIMLRWAPANYESWQRGNKNGYFVDRYTIIKDNRPYPDRRAIRLNRHTIKPISVDEWEKMAEYDNYAGVAAQAIYGEDFEVGSGEESTVVSIFNRATEQQNRYSFAMFAADYSASVARGMGLMFTDKNVAIGEKYLYVVYLAGTDTLKTDTAYTFTGPDEIVPLGKPGITQSVAEDRQVTLEWISPSGRNGYTSFEIERSGDGGQTFILRNTSPLINTKPDDKISDYNFYIDTLPENNKKYIYRVRGINPFGERGPYSDTVSVMGKEKISDMPYIVKHEVAPDGVNLEWEFNRKSEKNIRGFQVVRSTLNNKRFEPVSDIIPVNGRSFKDPRPLATAYYKIYALDRDNHPVSSFPVLVQPIDSIPPSAPIGLQASVDTNGKVFLNWKGNPEPDIFGYRIYRANTGNEEFSQLTVAPVTDSFYLDRIQLKTLSKKVYYRVMALDKRQNHSAFSDIHEVARPDVIPPVAPVIKNIYSSEKGICLEWVPSSSTDVKEEVILRRKDENDKWQELFVVPDTTTSFCDTLAEPGKIYDYTLAAYDETGLQSNIGQVFSGKKQFSARTIELSYKIRRNNGTIELFWEPADLEGKYILYRAAGNKPLMTFATIVPKNKTYIDSKVTPKTTYRYVLKHLANGNIEISNVVVVNY